MTDNIPSLNLMKNYFFCELWRDEMAALIESDNNNNRVKWDSVKHAQKYWDRTKKDTQRPLDQIAMIKPKSSDRVLDIGSGPGTLSIPLAKTVKSVVCIDQSIGMCSVLLDRIAEEELRNISVIQKRWEDVLLDEDLGIADVKNAGEDKTLDSEKFSIVIASYSLSMPNLPREIGRMRRCCKADGKIYIFWFAGEFRWDDSDMQKFWETLKYDDFYPGPKTNLLYPALLELGIYPNITHYPLSIHDIYQNADEAALKISQRHGIKDESDREKLRAYFVEKFGSGVVDITGSSKRACLCWNNSE